MGSMLSNCCNSKKVGQSNNRGGGYGGIPIVEGVPGHVDGVDASDYVIKDGLLTLPDTPGFGMNLCL